MSIDWSKAPEGATHWDPVDCNYLRQLGEIAQCWHEREHGWTCKGWQYPDDLSIMPRLIKRPAWSGEGLPPVGLKVECLIHGNGGWCELTMKYRSTDFSVFERADGEEFPLWNPQYSNFRSIRTAEDIAEAQRNADLNEMVRCVKDYPAGRHGAHHIAQLRIQEEACINLYDAGYRKQEATQ